MARYESYGAQDTVYQDGIDTNFNAVNNRVRPDALNQGVLQESDNFRFDVGGIAQVRKSIEVKSAPLTLDATRAFTLPFRCYANVTSTNVQISSTTLTFTFSSHSFVNDTLVFINDVPGVTGFDAGNYIVTVSGGSTTQFSITVAGIGGSPSSTTVVCGAPALSAAFLTEVYGSCVYSDPSGVDPEEYIILAGNANAVAVKISDNSTTSISYPSGILLSSSVNMIQAFNKIIIFRNGSTALEWNGTLTGSPAFTKVPNGSFTQPTLKSTTNGCTIVSSKVTVTLANSSTDSPLAVGDKITIVDKGGTALTVGKEFEIAEASDTDFSFFANDDEVPNVSNVAIELTKRVSAGEGFIHMPAADFGIVHSERLVVPFLFDSAAVPSRREDNPVDEVIFSEPFIDEQYDPVKGRGRLFPGRADSIVGLFSFTDDALIIFNRNSIFKYQPTVDLASMKKTLITDEVGLVAKDSVVQVGNNILFLSDNGVYGASFQDLYNLRGNDAPLSQPIQKTINRINKDHQHKSVATYFNNRYFLAVPLDDSTRLNALIIYNFLTKSWESVDTVGSTDISNNAVNFDFNNLLVAGDGSNRGVYTINRLGGVHRLVANESQYDQVITQIDGSTQSVKIPAKLRTRQFNFQNTERKKWNSFELQLESSQGESSNFDITFNLDNPVEAISGGKMSDYLATDSYESDFNYNPSNLPAGESVSIRGRIGNRRAYGLDIELTNFDGRPKIETVLVSGGLAYKSTQSSQERTITSGLI